MKLKTKESITYFDIKGNGDLDNPYTLVIYRKNTVTFHNVSWDYVMNMIPLLREKFNDARYKVASAGFCFSVDMTMGRKD